MNAIPNLKKSTVYGTNLIFIQVLLSGLLLMGCFFIYLAYKFNDLTNNEPEFIRWFIGVLGIVFLLGASKPSKWRQWITFALDEKGIYFPDSLVNQSNLKWLFIPWAKVGRCEIVTVVNRKGVAISIQITETEKEHFFKSDMMVHKISEYFGFESNKNTSKYFTVVYPQNLFYSNKKVLKAINDLRASRICTEK